MLSRTCVFMTVALIMSLTFGTALCAEEVAPVVPSEAAAVAAPNSSATPFVPDTDVFRRTPTIDGSIDDGEWDVFYTCSSGDWNAGTFVNWDSGCLYMAVRSNKPFDLMSVVDANADGWFHGDENYEFKAMRGTDGSLKLEVGRYESRNTKSPMASPVPDSEAALIEIKSGQTGDLYTTEMRIPAALIRELRLKDGRKIGFNMMLRTAAEEAGWFPTNQIGDVRECTLKAKKSATLKPLEVGFDLREYVIARGDTLSGKFHLTNSGAEQLDVRSFVIGGEGKAAEYLSSQRVRLEGLSARQHISHGVTTLIPSDMPVGSWAIGAEVRSGTGKLGAALVSFEVVDPFDVQIRIPTGDVRSDVKDVSLSVDIKNNMRRSISGVARITVPVGWELWRNLTAREFEVGGDGGEARVVFKAKPPLGEMGDVVIKIEVTVGKETKTVEGSFRVVNP